MNTKKNEKQPKQISKIITNNVIPAILLIIVIILLAVNVKKNNIVKAETLGQIELISINQNNQPVVGEKFILKDSTDKVLGEIQSGTDGKIKFYSVPIGNYTLEVSEALEGYEPQETSKQLVVKPGEKTNVVFKNTWKNAHLTINIVDDANVPIPNVPVILYNEEGFFLETLTSNDEGFIYKDLANGIYYFKEEKFSDKYILDETLYKLKVDNENKTFSQVVVNNRFLGNLLLVLTAQNKAPVPNIEYNILDGNKNIITTITTNEKGLAGAKNLPLGTYYYQEKNQKYDKEMHEFKIENNEQIVRFDLSTNQ